MIRRVITTAIVAVMLIDTALFHAPAATAVEFGWQSLPEGGVEYLIQVEPQLIETFREHGYTSDLPPGLRDIRRVRVVVGTEKLPNQGNLAGPAPAVPPPMGPQLLDPMRTFTADTPPPTNADQEPNKFTPVPDPKTVPAAGVADVTPMPTLHPGEGPPTDSSVQDTVGKPNSQVTPQAAPERPWGLLMVLLFALFLSLGANTYLVWIHQALRARFRALTPSPSGRGLG